MSEDLDFAALQADDQLLDALGARRRAGSLDDPIAGLLDAYVSEIDTRPGPLTPLISPEADGTETLPALPMPAEPALVPAPAVALPSARRRRLRVAPRVAALATAGAVVIGAGGVAAAVSGEGGPLDGLRRVMGSVTEQISPQRSAPEQISRLLVDADKALTAEDLQSARTYLEMARTELATIADQGQTENLRDDLVQLRDRWRNAIDDGTEDAGFGPAAEQVRDEAEYLRGVPGDAEEIGRGAVELVPGTEVEDAAEGLPEVSDTKPDLAEAKGELTDLEPLPDLPVGNDAVGPTWSPIVGQR